MVVWHTAAHVVKISCVRLQRPQRNRRLHEVLNVFDVITLSRALSHGEANAKLSWPRPDKTRSQPSFSSSTALANTSVVLDLNPCDVTDVSRMSVGHAEVTRIEGRRIYTGT